MKTIAFGPEMPGWGSWEWVGADIAATLKSHYQTVIYQGEIPACDLCVRVKIPPDPEWLLCLPKDVSLIYCPIDFYSSVSELERDIAFLTRCDHIVVHCERLRRYFSSYAPVTYIDHHVKFAASNQGEVEEILWVGVTSNIPPVVDWINHHSLPLPLRLLANFDLSEGVPTPQELGFRKSAVVRTSVWSPQRHLQLVASCKAAIDIKGVDFRSRNKPSTKAIDYLASGIPLALQKESSSFEHLGQLGFEVATPTDCDRWLSPTYRSETRQFGAALTELLSLNRIATRWRLLIDRTLMAHV
jgi:hypothetical protein